MVALVDGREVGCGHVFGVNDVFDSDCYPMKWTSGFGRYGVERSSRFENQIGIKVCPALYHRISLLDSRYETLGTAISTGDVPVNSLFFHCDSARSSQTDYFCRRQLIQRDILGHVRQLSSCSSRLWVVTYIWNAYLGRNCSEVCVSFSDLLSLAVDWMLNLFSESFIYGKSRAIDLMLHNVQMTVVSPWSPCRIGETTLGHRVVMAPL